MKYSHPEAGEWYRPVRKGYRISCCDCGLVHVLNMRLKKEGKGHYIEFQWFLNKRATAAIRRGRKHD